MWFATSASTAGEKVAISFAASCGVKFIVLTILIAN
jgi:hypothetical protein